MKEICNIEKDRTVYATVIRNNFNENGISFLTPDNYSQQLAFMKHSKGHKIKPHIHNAVKREIRFTTEVLVIKKGKLRCDFFTEEKEYISSIILYSGDVVLLVSGGHGFECLEDVEMYEIKQGPYVGDNDKTRFETNNQEIKLVRE